MSVVVTKSSPVVVRPSEPAGSSHINLSSADECQEGSPVTALLVFDHPIDDPVETIKRALSQALGHYQPIAGRLVDDGGVLRIACTGEGVSFVGASANYALRPTSMMLQINDVVLRYPAELCGHGDPLLLMQVTEFMCGGFTVAVTWNHVVADGMGMAQFLQAVDELVRGMPAPSVLPVRSCEQAGSLPVVPPSTVAMHRARMNLLNKDLMALDVTLPWSLIRADSKPSMAARCSRLSPLCSGGAAPEPSSPIPRLLRHSILCATYASIWAPKTATMATAQPSHWSMPPLAWWRTATLETW
jgi:hypothetical protein